MLRRVEKCSGMLTLGTVLITNPSSRQLHQPGAERFWPVGRRGAWSFAAPMWQRPWSMRPARTGTYRSTLPHYAAGADVNDLAGAAAGFPAVCIGAGPSLSRNIELLT